MVHDDHETNQSGKMQEKRQWCTHRKLIIVFLLTTIGLIIGFLFAFLVFNLVSEKRCTNPSCIIAASDVIKSIDRAIDPCENFYKFACGGLLKRAHEDHRFSPVNNVRQTVNRQVVQLIKEPISDDNREHFVVKNAKKLMGACVKNEGDLKGFRKKLDPLGGWPVVKGYRWDEEHFDWKETMYQLKEAGFSPNVFFQMNIEEDPTNATQYILYLEEPVSKLSNISDMVKYREAMVETATNFGADRHRANVEMGKTLAFMKDLESIAEEEESAKLDFVYRRYRIERYQVEYNNINWLGYINNLLSPETKLTYYDYVVFPSHKYTEGLFKLLEKTPKRTIANYIFWKLINENLIFLPNSISDAIKSSKCTKRTHSDEVFEACKKMVKNLFPINPFDVIYARRYLPKEKRNHVQNMLGNIKVKMMEMLNGVSWMDQQTKEAVIEKTRAISESIGTPGDYFNDDVFDIIGQDMEAFENETFLEMSLQLSSRKMNFLIKRLNTHFREIWRLRYYDYAAVVNALYSQENTIIIPAGLLQELFFDQQRPEYLNYGALGSAIAHELTHAFGKEGAQFNANGENEPIWTNVTLEAYENISQCVVDETENFDLEVTEKKLNGTGTLEENIADYASVKVSYLAYKKWVEEHGEEERLPGLNYNPYQLFWISAISYQCSHFAIDNLETLMRVDPHAPASFRAFGPLRNNINFGEDFNCPEGSPMNPKDKCEVF